MSVLVYAESWKGSFRKSTYEVTTYAKEPFQLSAYTNTDIFFILNII
jgi:hypothetical protein